MAAAVQWHRYCELTQVYFTTVLQEIAFAVHWQVYATTVLQEMAAAMYWHRCIPLLCFKRWWLLWNDTGVCHHCTSRDSSCCALTQVYTTTLLQEMADAVLWHRSIPPLCFKRWQLLCTDTGVCHHCALRDGSCCALTQVYGTTMLLEMAAAVHWHRCMPPLYAISLVLQDQAAAVHWRRCMSPLILEMPAAVH